MNNFNFNFWVFKMNSGNFLESFMKYNFEVILKRITTLLSDLHEIFRNLIKLIPIVCTTNNTA